MFHFVERFRTLCGSPVAETRDPWTEVDTNFLTGDGADRCVPCERAFRISRGLPVLYIVPAENKAAIDARAAKLNKKAAKLGVPGITVTFAHHHTETWKVEKVEGCPAEGYVEHAREWLSALVHGAAVRLAGWSFIATLHHTSDGNIIAAVPGNEVPREYRNAPSACAHCKTTRRRSATYLLQQGDTTVQVGSDCLQDFLGNDPHRMASWAEALGAFNSWFVSNEEPSGAWAPDTFTLGSFLTHCAAFIRLNGWVSKKYAQESERTATASDAWSYMTRRIVTREDRQYHEKYRPIEEDTATATAALLWAREALSAEQEDMNDYEHNLGVVVRSGLVNLRVSGLAASLIQAHRRATTVKEEKEAAKNAPESNHVGTVGERLRDVAVKVDAVIPMPPTDFGPRVLLKVRDESGNLLVWFTGSVGSFKFPEVENFRMPEKGDSMWLTGTVKEHSSFAGLRQTVLSRCALASVAPAPKKAKKVKA